MKNRRWTPEEDDIIRSWYAARNSSKIELATLAAQLGRPRIATCVRAKKLGVTNPRRKTGRKRRRVFDTAEARSEYMSNFRRQWHQTHPHPRGALGMKHSAATKAKLAELTKQREMATTKEEKARQTQAAVTTKIAKYGNAGPGAFSQNAYSRCVRGKRSDLGKYNFRSRWEANYARYLNFLQQHGKIQSWTYETKTFQFDGIVRGCRTYTPDFPVVMPDGSVEYHEVKGWMDSKSATRLKRMKKYHPKEKVVLIDQKRYAGIERSIGLALPNWEKKGDPIP